MDLSSASQEVEITNQTTGIKCSPNANGELPVRAGQTGTWVVDQGQPGATSDAWYAKITDGDYVAGVDAAGGLYVAGKAAPGASPSSNPVYIAGVDVGGLKRGILTDTSGKPYVLTENYQVLSPAVYAYQSKMFIAAVDGFTPGTSSEVAMALLRNTSGSKTIIIDRIFFSTSENDDREAFVKCYLDPTITSNGTTITPVSLSLGSGATSSVDFSHTPEVSAYGTFLRGMAIQAASSQDIVTDFAWRLEPGHNLLLSCIGNLRSVVVFPGIVWAEV